MTENMSDDSPTTKKRKANDGRATVPHDGGGRGLFSSWLGYFSSGRRDDSAPTASSATCDGENLTQKLDRMEKMMIRMEERQLATVSNLFRIEERQLMAVGSLESRCERLESKCSVLEHMLGDMREIQLRQHQYNIMLVKNQSWKYSAPVYSEEHWINDGYDDDVAFYLSESTACLKRFTENMRRGEFPDDYNDDYFRKGIDLEWAEEDPILDYNATGAMSPHWEEFSKALKQFTPAFGVLPDGFETFFTLENIQLPGNVAWWLKDALMHKPFQQLKFVNKIGVGDNEGMKLEDIMGIVGSNKHLRKLTIGNNRIQLDHMEKICSAVLNSSIVELDLRSCFEMNGVNGLGDDMITSLLCTGALAKLERLGFVSNGITSSRITMLANFLATNPPLKELDLEHNGSNDSDALVLANALRSNTTLRFLNLSGNNHVTDVGNEAFRLVVHGDGNNLNSIADSNHSCLVDGVGFDCWNLDDTCRKNRARKLYKLLSERNKSMSTSNVQYFDVIDVKLLPDILEAVQRHEGLAPLYDTHLPPCRSEYLSDDWRVKPLSIVYEVMRKWDKVFPLYIDEDNSGSIE